MLLHPFDIHDLRIRAHALCQVHSIPIENDMSNNSMTLLALHIVGPN
ncbi:hypothetical protein BVRB_4g074690 [Beta vulgaris subsp. vulgaris]|nr:hypothetical protein BVRB_4g074690 [Beta vulgaris subsp. vulgaris]